MWNTCSSSSWATAQSLTLSYEVGFAHAKGIFEALDQWVLMWASGGAWLNMLWMYFFGMTTQNPLFMGGRSVLFRVGEDSSKCCLQKAMLKIWMLAGSSGWLLEEEGWRLEKSEGDIDDDDDDGMFTQF